MDLTDALDTWQRTRATEAGDLVVALARVESRTAAPLEGRLAKERHVDWLARAGAAKDRLADQMFLLDNFDAAQVKSALGVERLAPVAAWEASPAVGRFLIQLLEKPPFQSTSTKPFWSALFKALPRHAEPVIVERLKALEGKGVERIGARTMGEFFDAQIPRLRAAVERELGGRERGSLDERTREKIRELITSVGNAKPVATQSLESLMAAVYEAPSDDGARAVLADFLLEKEDPRGEFINLQLQNADPKREASLFLKHAATWMSGPVSKVLARSSLRFERGFLSAAALQRNRPLKPAVGLPDWRTLHWLDVVFITSPPLVELLVDPVMRDLRVLTNLGGTVAAPYLRHEAAKGLETLMIASRFYGWESYEKEIVEALCTTASLPKLRHLVLEFKDESLVRPLFESPLARQLERLTLSKALASAVGSLPLDVRRHVRKLEMVEAVSASIDSSRGPIATS